MRQPTLYTALPFYLNSTKHLKQKQKDGYEQLKGTLSPSHLIVPFQIRTVAVRLAPLQEFVALECDLLGNLTGNTDDLSFQAAFLDIRLLDGVVYIISTGILAAVPYKNYVLKIKYADDEYYSELITQFDSGISYTPEIADSYIIEANTNTGIQFYDESIRAYTGYTGQNPLSIASVEHQGTAVLDIAGDFNEKIITTQAGTIANLTIVDAWNNVYFFPCVENMHTIHCVDTGVRAILNNYSWSKNGFNKWNLIHGATMLTADDGRVGFIPYTRDNKKLVVI